MFTLPNKILRFQIVALPRLENWDVMIVVGICPGKTEWRSIPFFRVRRKCRDVLEGQFLFWLKMEAGAFGREGRFGLYFQALNSGCTKK